MASIFLKKTNNGGSTLNGGITNIATSLIVTSATKFPVSGNFNVTIWNKTLYGNPVDDVNMEIVKVTNVAGNVFTITRAQEGTNAAAHSNLDAVELLVTKASLDEYETAINQRLEINLFTDVYESRNVTINRNASNLITSVQVASGRTLTPTRNASGFITSITDGTHTWTFTRNSNNFITSTTVS